MPCLPKANLDPSNSRKEPDNVEASRLSLSGHVRKSSRWTGGEPNVCSFMGQGIGKVPHRLQPISRLGPHNPKGRGFGTRCERLQSTYDAEYVNVIFCLR